MMAMLRQLCCMARYKNPAFYKHLPVRFGIRSSIFNWHKADASINRFFSEHSESQELHAKPVSFIIKLMVGATTICGAFYIARYFGIDETEELYVNPKTKDKDGLIKYNGVWLPRIFFSSSIWPQIVKFQVRPDDIFVVSYPKSGTTWVQEVVYLLLNKDNIDQARKDDLGTVFPYMEFPYPGLKTIDKKPSPRTLKTHLPLEFLPPAIEKVKPKIIYIARNVKDVSVSYYHFHRSMAQVSYSGSFHDFLEDFLIGRVSYDSWWKHVKSFWERRDDENILFVKYEDLKQNPVHEISIIAEFLNVRVSASELKKIAAACSFEEMKGNPATNQSWMEEYGLLNKATDQNMSFMRKGIVGDWKNYYTMGLAKIFDAKTEKELKDTGLKFIDGS